MLIPDVNVFINAENAEADQHVASRRWLLRAGSGDEALGVPPTVLLSVARVLTGLHGGARIASPDVAFGVCDAIRSMPAYASLTEGVAHWRIFEDLVRRSGISGRRLTDAYLAAFAIENEATFVTFDRGFARFPGLKVLVPQ